jgi:hypothetical protein
MAMGLGKRGKGSAYKADPLRRWQVWQWQIACFLISWLFVD